MPDPQARVDVLISVIRGNLRLANQATLLSWATAAVAVAIPSVTRDTTSTPLQLPLLGIAVPIAQASALCFFIVLVCGWYIAIIAEHIREAVDRLREIDHSTADDLLLSTTLLTTRGRQLFWFTLVPAYSVAFPIFDKTSGALVFLFTVIGLSGYVVALYRFHGVKTTDNGD